MLKELRVLFTALSFNLMVQAMVFAAATAPRYPKQKTKARGLEVV
jgi:hypothetical protein